jgi:hypothetical protein
VHKVRQGRAVSPKTLIARHGADFDVPALLSLLSDDCPKRKSITVYDLCGIHCPELPTFFLHKTDYLAGVRAQDADYPNNRPDKTGAA